MLCLWGNGFGDSVFVFVAFVFGFGPVRGTVVVIGSVLSVRLSVLGPIRGTVVVIGSVLSVLSTVPTVVAEVGWEVGLGSRGR